MSTTSVLFVCLGNICRSPMAEAVFTHMVKERGLTEEFLIDSAGTANYHVGDSPDSRSIATCKKHGVPVNHRGRQVGKDDFTRFDHIFCMDRSNLRDLQSIQPNHSKAQVRMLGELDPQGELIIEDPYYGNKDGFEHNFQQVTRCCEAFLQSLGHY